MCGIPSHSWLSFQYSVLATARYDMQSGAAPSSLYFCFLRLIPNTLLYIQCDSICQHPFKNVWCWWKKWVVVFRNLVLRLVLTEIWDPKKSAYILHHIQVSHQKYPENAIHANMPIEMQISTLNAEACKCIASYCILHMGFFWTHMVFNGLNNYSFLEAPCYRQQPRSYSGVHGSL